MLGKNIEGLELSFKGTTSKGNASDNKYTDQTGASISLKNNSQVDETFLNLGLDYKGFYARYIMDHFETKNPILWGDLNLSRGNVPKSFLTDAYNLGYNGKINKNLNTHFYYKHKVQLPWYQPDFDNQVQLENDWRREVTREVVGAKFFYAVNERLDFVFGAENQNDVSRSLNFNNRGGSPDVHGHNNSRVASLNNKAVFAQAQYKADFANLTVGLRQDTPDLYDSTLVPRFALTKVMDRFHVKFLHAKAFRAPVIENISLNKDIHPELTTTTEVEFGYVKSNNSFTLNLFNTAIEDIIVYSYDTDERYFNYDLVSTNGLEFEYKYISDKHSIKTNVSYYQLNELQDSAPFETYLDEKSTFGAPRYKVWLSDAYQLSESFFITPSLVYYKDIYAKDWKDSSWKETKLDDQMILNLFLNKKDVYVKGLELGFGVRNLTDTDIRLAQPYKKPGDVEAGPYPGQSREYIARVGYTQNF